MSSDQPVRHLTSGLQNAMRGNGTRRTQVQPVANNIPTQFQPSVTPGLYTFSNDVNAVELVQLASHESNTPEIRTGLNGMGWTFAEPVPTRPVVASNGIDGLFSNTSGTVHNPTMHGWHGSLANLAQPTNPRRPSVLTSNAGRTPTNGAAPIDLQMLEQLMGISQSAQCDTLLNGPGCNVRGLPIVGNLNINAPHPHRYVNDRCGKKIGNQVPVVGNVYASATHPHAHASFGSSINRNVRADPIGSSLNTDGWDGGAALSRTHADPTASIGFEAMLPRRSVVVVNEGTVALQHQNTGAGEPSRRLLGMINAGGEGRGLSNVVANSTHSAHPNPHQDELHVAFAAANGLQLTINNGGMAISAGATGIYPPPMGIEEPPAAPNASVAARCSVVGALSSQVDDTHPILSHGQPMPNRNGREAQKVSGGISKYGNAVRRQAKRRPRTYSKAVPSQHCHICSRRPAPRSPHVACGNLLQSRCRKTICVKCFERYNWDLEAARNAEAGTWLCTHCRGECPSRAQCVIYNRTTDRRRMNLINHHKRRAPQSSGFGNGPTSRVTRSSHSGNAGVDAGIAVSMGLRNQPTAISVGLTEADSKESPHIEQGGAQVAKSIQGRCNANAGGWQGGVASGLQTVRKGGIICRQREKGGKGSEAILKRLAEEFIRQTTQRGVDQHGALRPGGTVQSNEKRTAVSDTEVARGMEGMKSQPEMLAKTACETAGNGETKNASEVVECEASEGVEAEAEELFSALENIIEGVDGESEAKPLEGLSRKREGGHELSSLAHLCPDECTEDGPDFEAWLLMEGPWKL